MILRYNVSSTKYSYLCIHFSVLVFKYIPGRQAQLSTQSPLHVSGIDKAWQVCPQVDMQVLYSFVSSHERATQKKQFSNYIARDSQTPLSEIFLR